MERINKMQIEIHGSKYMIATTESEEYVEALANELNEQIDALQQKNKNLSLNEALVLCAINYADCYKKSEENSDNMRTQLAGYVEDAARARIELDEAKRELERLGRKIAMNKAEGQLEL